MLTALRMRMHVEDGEEEPDLRSCVWQQRCGVVVLPRAIRDVMFGCVIAAARG